MPTPMTNQTGFSQDMHLAALLNEVIGKATGIAPTREAPIPQEASSPDGRPKIDLGSRYVQDGRTLVAITATPPAYGPAAKPQFIRVDFAAGVGEPGKPAKQLTEILQRYGIQASTHDNALQNGAVAFTYDNALIGNLERALRDIDAAQGPASAKALAGQTRAPQGEYQDAGNNALANPPPGWSGRL